MALQAYPGEVRKFVTVGFFGSRGSCTSFSLACWRVHQCPSLCFVRLRGNQSCRGTTMLLRHRGPERPRMSDRGSATRRSCVRRHKMPSDATPTTTTRDDDTVDIEKVLVPLSEPRKITTAMATCATKADQKTSQIAVAFGDTEIVSLFIETIKRREFSGKIANPASLFRVSTASSSDSRTSRMMIGIEAPWCSVVNLHAGG